MAEAFETEQTKTEKSKQGTECTSKEKFVFIISGEEKSYSNILPVLKE